MGQCSMVLLEACSFLVQVHLMLHQSHISLGSPDVMLDLTATLESFGDIMVPLVILEIQKLTKSSKCFRGTRRGRSALHGKIQAVYLPWVNTWACTGACPSRLYHILWPDICSCITMSGTKWGVLICHRDMMGSL